MGEDDRNRIKQRLFKEYLPDVEGEWEIRGEDPNCDLGGPHGNPLLTTVKGRFRDVVEYAFTLSGFVGWGYGGEIKKINHTTITVPKGFTAESLQELYAKKEKLEKELQLVIEKIRNLDIDYE